MEFLYKLVLFAVFVFCYWWGGRRNKWVRQWLGNSILSVGLIGLAVWQQYEWLSYVGALTIFGGLQIPYGKNYTHDTLEGKLFWRLLRGSVIGLGGGLFLCGAHHCALAVPHFLLASIPTTYLGVWNPLEAEKEEVSIALLFISLLLFS